MFSSEVSPLLLAFRPGGHRDIDLVVVFNNFAIDVRRLMPTILAPSPFQKLLKGSIIEDRHLNMASPPK